VPVQLQPVPPAVVMSASATLFRSQPLSAAAAAVSGAPSL